MNDASVRSYSKNKSLKRYITFSVKLAKLPLHNNTSVLSAKKASEIPRYQLVTMSEKSKNDC